MQLDLTTFEVQVDPTILQRGQKYFKEGAVINLEELVKGHWYAEVAGTDTYEVEITLSRTKVKHFECSCPYDLGPVCKHVVAVLYTLRKDHSGTKKPAKSQTVAKDKIPTKKQMLQEVLDTVSYPELKAFLLEYALKKNEFGGMLLARFAEQTGVEGKEKYVLIIRNAVSAGAGRGRFIEYHDVPKVMKPVKALLQQAQILFARKQYAEVVNLCQAVIEEIAELAQNMEDANGQGTGAVEDAFALLLQICGEPIPVPLQETLFQYTLQEADKKPYRYHDFYIFWYQLLDALAHDAVKEKQVISFVQEKLDQQARPEKPFSKDDRGFRGILSNFLLNNHDEQQLAFYLVNFYLKRQRQPEADAIIQQYRHIPQFREIIIKQALQAQQFLRAKQQINEAQALEKQNGYGRSENHWNEWLLRIAEQEQNSADVRTLAATLF